MQPPPPGFQREGSTFHHVVCYVTHQTTRSTEGIQNCLPHQTEEEGMKHLSPTAVYPASYERSHWVFIIQAFRTVRVQYTQCFIHAVKLIILTFLAETH